MFNPNQVKTLSHVGYALYCQFNFQASCTRHTQFFHEIKDEKEVINIIDASIKDYNLLKMRDLVEEEQEEGSYGIGIEFKVFVLYGEDILNFENGEKILFPTEGIYAQALMERNWDYQTLMGALPSRRLKNLF